MINKIKNILFGKEKKYSILRRQFVKFVIVGGMNTAISFITFYILTKLFLIDDKISNIISYIVGLINSYVFNKFWTFKSKNFSISEMLKFIIIFFISFGIQISIYTFLKDYLNVYIYISYFIGMIFYTVTNFVLNKFITFKK